MVHWSLGEMTSLIPPFPLLFPHLRLWPQQLGEITEKERAKMARTRTASGGDDDSAAAGAEVTVAAQQQQSSSADDAGAPVPVNQDHEELHRGIAAAHEAAAAAVAANNEALVQAYMNLAPPAATSPAMSHHHSQSVVAGAEPQAGVNAAPMVAVAHLIRDSMSGGASSLPAKCPPFRESYSDMGELRRELKVISVRMSLPYYMQHSSPQRLEARCPTWKHRKTAPTTCEFVVSANRHTNGRVYVTRAVVAHGPNCSVAQSNSGNFVSAAALMETAKPFMAQAGDGVRPKDMAGIMKDQFGVSTSYMTAWRALSAFRQQKKMEESASFMKIRGYLDAFVKINEGSVAAFEHLPGTTTFARAFLCPKPLQVTLRYCRSSVLLSVFRITSAYGGVLMTATTQDAMGDNVPIAVSVAPVESDENWLFFLKQLQKAIPDFGRSVLTFVHSRGDDLQRPLHDQFPSCPQSDAVEIFATSSISAGGSSSSSAASASTLTPDASFQWLENLCAKTPLMILVGWVSKVASTLFQRFEKYGQNSTEYPEEFHSILTQYEGEANHYEVLRVSENCFEVIDHQTGRQRIVDFNHQSCTCGEYDVARFPCLHVFLAISSAGLMRAEVIPRMFLISSLKTLYGGRITPIDVETVESDKLTAPIPQPKSRGRPRKIQQIQQFGDVKQEKLACSICGVKGHNKRTCKRVLSGGGGGNVSGNSSSNPHDLSSGLHASSSVEEDDEESAFLDSTCKLMLYLFALLDLC